ncbi:hypothetical protein [Aquipuribacter nitratireducens]|uniref:DUF2007 domain-containing protein n=1 Tax=Aquipuribacter nitratireducens TaxID=650104 RepID=A0ABW0GMZ8_9MICO
MPAWESYSFAFGPLAALVVLAVLVVLLRWTFSRGRSVVERRSRPGAEDEYGLLVPVARPATFVEAEVLRQRLLAHSIRATLAPTTEGPRVMVWPQDLDLARSVLATDGR